MQKDQDRRKRKIKKIQKDDIGATAIFVINRNGGCPLFLISQKIILLSAFIYECVDQPRKVDVPRGLGMCHNKLFASDTYPCTAC